MDVDLADLENDALISSMVPFIRRVSTHSSIYEHLFNANVYFNNVIPFRVAYSDVHDAKEDMELPMYYGNEIKSEDVCPLFWVLCFTYIHLSASDDL